MNFESQKLYLTCVLQLLTITVLVSQTKYTKNYNIVSGNDYKKNSFASIGDTIQLDTIVIRYKKKDTSIIVGRYKGKIPIFFPTLGGYTNIKKASVDTMKMLIDSPIVVYDNNKNAYRVVSFLFGYKKKDEYIDDETMDIKTSYDYHSFYVLQDSLPTKFKKHIKEYISSNEKFYFDKIIIENSKGEKFLAPNFDIETY